MLGRCVRRKSAKRPNKPKLRAEPEFIASDSLQLDIPVTTDSPRPRFRDSAFMANRTVPVHRWIPWIAGFSSAFVEDCMTNFLGDPKGRTPTVLDPFAGVGTTLVASVLKGYDSVGFEINPYAALACRVKVNAPTLDVARLKLCRRRYADLSRNGYERAEGKPPDGFISRIPFFSPAIEEQVYGLMAFLRTIKDPTIADIFRLAFGASMVGFSNYTYEPSLCSRPGAGKPLVEKADVHASVLRKVSEMTDDVVWMQKEVERTGQVGKGKVHELNFMRSPEVMEPGTIDLAVTSPPYLNNYHYVRSTRPQLYWLGLIQERADLRRLEQENVGKYWQTVRDAKEVPLTFKHEGLARLLGAIRNTRIERRAYGGPGWANYAASYFNDTYDFLGKLRRTLARRGIAVIVIGNSIIQGHEIKVELFLADLAAQQGLVVGGIEQLRTKRVGASITKSTVRRGQTNQATLYESAVILHKR